MVSFHLMGLSQKVYALRKRGKIVCPVGESRAVIVCGECAGADAVTGAFKLPLNAVQVAGFFEGKDWRRPDGEQWVCPTCTSVAARTQQRSQAS